MALDYIDNGVIRVGVDPSRGCTIYSISLIATGEEVLIPSAPMAEGVCWNCWGGNGGGSSEITNGTEWNPNQTGSWPWDWYSTLLAYNKTADSIYAKLDLVDFLGEDAARPAQMYLEMWITLIGPSIKLRYKSTYYGSYDHGVGQPADNIANGYPDWYTKFSACIDTFVSLSLANIVGYVGDSPWTNADLTSAIPLVYSGVVNNSAAFHVFQEPWAALINPSTGRGLGIYSSDSPILACLTRPGVSNLLSIQFPHNYSPTDPVLDTTSYLTIGTTNEIRARFYEIHDAATDYTAPTVTAFATPATSTSLTVAVTALTATDNVGVAGYLITESATPPSASDPGWSTTAPTSYTFATAGSKALYAWAKDEAGNVSAGVSAGITITLPSTSSQFTDAAGKQSTISDSTGNPMTFYGGDGNPL